MSPFNIYRTELHTTQDTFNEKQASLGRSVTLYARYEQEEANYKQAQVVYERKQQSLRQEAEVLYAVDESVIKDSWEVATAGQSDGTSRVGDESILTEEDKEILAKVIIDLSKRLENGEALEGWEWNLIDFVENEKIKTINDVKLKNIKYDFNTYFERTYGNAHSSFIQAEDLLIIGGIVRWTWKGLSLLFAKKAAISGSTKIGGFAVNELLKSAKEPLSNGMTKSGRALQKHSEGAGSRITDILKKYKKPKGSGSNSNYYNPISERILKNIMSDTNKLIIKTKDGFRIFKDGGSGEGAHFINGKFNTFNNPIK